MQLSDLVGFQIINLNNEEMTVQKDTNIYMLKFECDYGGCCGYSNITNTLLFDPSNTNKNPVITNIETTDGESEYGDSDSISITLFGGYKPLAKIEAEAGSGSGWCYGATVTVECQQLQINETIVSW